MGRRFTRMRMTIACLCLAAVLTACGSAPGEDEKEQEAYSALEGGDYEGAADAYQKLIGEGDDSEEAYRFLGIAYMGQGDYEKAVTAFENSLQQTGVLPGSMEYDINYYLGSCYYKLEQYDKALQVYDAILALHPNDAGALQMRGRVKTALGDLPGMKEDFEKAIALEPANYDRVAAIFNIMNENGYTEDAKQLVSGVMQSGSETMDDYNRGRLYYCLGDYRNAQKALESLSGSNDYRVCILLGQTYEALGDYNYAANVYESFITRDQTHPEVYNQLGLCNMKLQDYQGALAAFQSGKEIENNEILQSLSFNEIAAYEYLGNFRQAAALLDDYIRKYPGDTVAKREYIFLKHAKTAVSAEG